MKASKALIRKSIILSGIILLLSFTKGCHSDDTVSLDEKDMAMMLDQ